MQSDQPTEFYYTRARFSERPFRPYALAIGQATLAWNGLNEHLGNLFWVVTGGSPNNWQALDVWQSVTSDRSKREMLRAAAIRSPFPLRREFPKLVASVEWICAQGNRIEDKRNDLVHAPLILTVDRSVFASAVAKDGKVKHADVLKIAQVNPHAFHLNRRAGKLTDKDILAEYRWCRDMSLMVRTYADGIFASMTEAKPWPRRPQLPARPHPKPPNSPTPAE